MVEGTFIYNVCQSYVPGITHEFFRICPGRHFALRVLFLTVAQTLTTFDISKCLDENGNQITPEGGSTVGVIS